MSRHSPDQNPLPFPDTGSHAEPRADDHAANPAAGLHADPDAALAAPRLPRRDPRRPLWARLLGRTLAPWIALKIEPQAPAGLVDDRPVCYVLEDYGLSNALILDRACREAGMPSPLQPLPGDPVGRKRAYVALSRRNAAGTLNALAKGKRPPKPSTHSETLARLLEAHRADPSLDVQLLPVSIFVGRSPDKASGWFSVLFSENWALVGRFRRLLAILLNGRDTLVRFASPVEVRGIIAEDLSPERTVRKVSRVLRVHFNRIREAVVGPDLSTRRLLVDKVLSAATVQEAIADQARRDNSSNEDAWKKAYMYAYEIAADYSHPVVRSASFLLTSVWNRIYRGVLVHHLDTLKAAAPGHEIVYVPSHRSHMDYLLLSYLLYNKGIVPPHIVAGINLNLPVVGTILRKGGAFYIRRSIRGNALYSAVLSEYVAQLVAGGYSIEYFIEGGRSRTGRLLQPKGGMVSMTVRAYLRQPTRPVLFQPVYIGYEKLMEGTSYLDELTGKPKQKESIWQLLWGIPKVLRQNYGQVVVNFGEAIPLQRLLAEHASDWDGRPLSDDERPEWLSRMVDATAERIQVHINRAADVNPINFLALALLSTPKHAMSESDLLAQIALSKTTLTDVPYSDLVTVTPHTPAEIVAHGEEIGVLQRISHPLGDVLRVDDETAVLLSYFRNNVVHLFTASGWIASCFHNNRRMSGNTLLRLGRSLYPFLQAELFLPWDADGFVERLELTIQVFVREGLLERVGEDEGGIYQRNSGQTDEVFRLRALGHPLQQAFERYYIAISVLAKNGPGTLGAAELENLCQQAAQRLSLLYAPAAPEFFDRSLFRGFIQKLRELDLVKLDQNSKLVFDQRLDVWARDAKVILGRELRHTIEKISPAAVRPDSDPSVPA
ncbi:glycerol-3-phosphate 1-O-acyltransferase PlsB [Luteimonas sp. MHLX1A]|uniref:glycerol-3-phosphate 1-O-acyltransferase PlsB n=1 Tax=Alterluteimonas muca TaxID=2878684 RepID=UPI001E4B4B62|nr:glycerol-3-phosphate 1-O-acyltransferase PlsB [Luteimonas sp. MHLX1A]MCD9048057.1 glycerol-3-phosphate 1-O-acyltransferase PlsB [Luteimonas sp. MHLX1A]